MTEDRALMLAYELACSRRDRAEALAKDLEAENAKLRARLRLVELLEEESARRWGLGHSIRVLS